MNNGESSNPVSEATEHGAGRDSEIHTKKGRILQSFRKVSALALALAVTLGSVRKQFLHLPALVLALASGAGERAKTVPVLVPALAVARPGSVAAFR